VRERALTTQRNQALPSAMATDRSLFARGASQHGRRLWWLTLALAPVLWYDLRRVTVAGARQTLLAGDDTRY
jgi:hypothetical protein